MKLSLTFCSPSIVGSDILRFRETPVLLIEGSEYVRMPKLDLMEVSVMSKRKSSGKTIQTLAVIVLVIEIIASVFLSALACLAVMSAVESQYEPAAVAFGVAVLVILLICSFVGYVFLRSYGELVEDNRRSREALEMITSKLKSNN